jgi:hypothetical protein
MKCPSCQAEVTGTMPVCPNCGTDLSEGMATAPVQAETVTAPLPGPQPESAARGASDRSLFLDFNEKPANIILVMDEARLRRGEFVKSFRSRLRILLLLLPAGLLFLLLDPLLGYGSVTFTLVACVLWGAALVGWYLLRRESLIAQAGELKTPKGGRCGFSFTLIFVVVFAGIVLFSLGLFSLVLDNFLLVVGLLLGLAASACLVWLWLHQPRGEAFGARFEAAYTIFQTLKDDLAPRRTLLGWLDLSGPQQPGKVVREATSGTGMPIKYYRDEWLRMKMPLYDGNLLRVSAVQRVKARQGRWKRGSSGKRKWKSGGTPQATSVLRVAVAVDRQAYEIVPAAAGTVNHFWVDIPPSAAGRLELRAVSDAPMNAWDILSVLHFAHDHIKPRVAEAVAEVSGTGPAVSDHAGGPPSDQSSPTGMAAGPSVNIGGSNT